VKRRLKRKKAECNGKRDCVREMGLMERGEERKVGIWMTATHG